MLFARSVLLVGLICAIGLTSVANGHHRRARSLIPPSVQRMAQTTGEKTVEAFATFGRVVGILPPNDTTVIDSASSDSHEPLSFFGEIPLKFISVVKGTQEEQNTTSTSATIAEPKPAPAEQDAEPVSVKLVAGEALPEPEALKSSGFVPSETDLSTKTSPPLPVEESEPADIDPVSADPVSKVDPDLVAAYTDSDAANPLIADTETDSAAADAADVAAESDLAPIAATEKGKSFSEEEV